MNKQDTEKLEFALTGPDREAALARLNSDPKIKAHTEKLRKMLESLEAASGTCDDRAITFAKYEPDSEDDHE